MAGAETPAATITVEFVCSPGQRQVEQLQLTLPAGATVDAALAASGALQRHAALAADPQRVCALWGRAVAGDVALRDGDRLALCRGLQVDPKEARRLRYRSQAERRQAPARRQR